MGNKNRVVVNILGQDYPLMSEDDRDYMQKVSYLVDDRMQEVSNANKKLGKTMVAVLTALNLADDYVKAIDEKAELEAQVENLLNAIEENSFAEVKDIVEDNGEMVYSNPTEGDDFSENENEEDNQSECIQFDDETHDDKFQFFKQEIDELRGKIEDLSSAVMSRDSELEQSNELIKMLEKKLAENELELKTTKNQLYKSEEELEEFIKEFDEATN